MEDLFHSVSKILAHNIVVHVYSVPNFSLECFVFALVCVVHLLLIMEINSIVAEVIEKSMHKLRCQKRMKGDISRFSLNSSDSLLKLQRNVGKYTENQTPFLQHHQTRIEEEYTWEPSKIETEKFGKIDEILSISPSDYVKKDREERVHEKELRHCLTSLTALLEGGVASKMSTTSLSKSVKILNEHLRSEKSGKSRRKIMEMTAGQLYDAMEKSMAGDGGIPADDSFSVYSSPSDTTAATGDLDSLISDRIR